MKPLKCRCIGLLALQLVCALYAQPILIQPQNQNMGGTSVSNLRILKQSEDGTEVTLTVDFIYDGTSGPTARLAPVITDKKQPKASTWFGADPVSVGAGHGTVSLRVKYFNDDPGVPPELTTDHVRVMVLSSGGNAVVGQGIFMKTIKWGSANAPAVAARPPQPPAESQDQASIRALAEARRVADEKAKAQAQAQEELRLKAEAEEKARQEAELKRQAEEQAAIAKAAEEARVKAEEEERLAAERAKAEEDARQARLKAAAEEKARQEAEARRQAEEQAKAAKAAEEARAKAEEEKRIAAERVKAEEEARQARLKAAAEEKARQEAELKHQAEEQAKEAKAQEEKRLATESAKPPATAPPSQVAPAPRKAPFAISAKARSKVTNIDVVNRNIDRTEMTVAVEYQYNKEDAMPKLGVDLASTDEPLAADCFTCVPVDIGKGSRNFVMLPVKLNAAAAQNFKQSTLPTDKVWIYLLDDSGQKSYIFQGTMLLNWHVPGAAPAPAASPGNTLEIDNFKQNDYFSGYIIVKYNLAIPSGKLRLRIQDSSDPAVAGYFASDDIPVKEGPGQQLVKIGVPKESKSPDVFSADTIVVQLLSDKNAVLATFKRQTPMSWAKPK